MKASLEHLPEHKREELHRLADAIRQACSDVEMIVLFGSYARGNYKEEEDLAPDRKSGAASDYDILVVTGEKNTVRNATLWCRVNDALRSLALSAEPRVIVHDWRFLADALKKKHYFFHDLFVEGIVLFDSGVFKPETGQKLTPEEHRAAAQEHFDQWYSFAREFFIDFQNAFDRKAFSKAAFELQQAAECAYKALLLVYTNYTPYAHHLAWFDDAIREVLPDLPDFFPRPTEEAQKRFENFDHAYIRARYDPKYRISESDLRYFADRVHLLLTETDSRCQSFLQK